MYLLAALTGMVYFLVAYTSLGVVSETNGVAIFWPAAGVSAGAAILFGRAHIGKALAAILLANLAANMAAGAS